MGFTCEQQCVIDARNGNLLVSAAAGSGKTSVLVQRIIDRVADMAHPSSIENLLVVTFTNAAAAEMRERIGDALEMLMAERPESLHLQRQLALLPSASITTIHAFCLKLVKQHYHLLDLDPGFAIGDETELELLKQQALEEALEDAYAQADPEFLEMAACFSPKAFDTALESVVLEAYDFSRSHPQPEAWLQSSLETYRTGSVQELSASPHGQLVLEEALEGLDYALHCFRLASGEAETDPALKNYLVSIREYVETAESLVGLLEKEGLAAMGTTAFSAGSPGRLKNAGKGADPEAKAAAKAWIDAGKKAIQEVMDLCPFKLDEAYFQRQNKMHGILKALAETVGLFSERYQAAKKEKQLIDFSDVEHYALALLYDKESGETTDLASLYQQQFDEVLTDEYQDSNQVQEAILHAVSKSPAGGANRFMVGDVKQSIYKFRLAMPELFMEKFDTYTEEEGSSRKMTLGRNFRSRRHILDFVNLVFERTMSRRFGDVDYDSSAALHFGAEYYSPGDERYANELVLAERTAFDGVKREELEAAMTASEIERLMAMDPPLKVHDKETGGTRPLEYGDIAVLMRSISGAGEVFAEVFAGRGIPVRTEKKTGYFEAIEVQTLLNMLRIIDNPRQDIPLLSVLRSPAVGLDGDELARIRLSAREAGIYESVLACRSQAGEGDALGRKLEGFLHLLAGWRGLRKRASVHELLQDILEKTGYYGYAALSDNGPQRTANIELLLTWSYQFEKTRMQGLSGFLRYIGQMQSRSMDHGEAAAEGMGDGCVRIMSIHKSKGLEFPVAILAGLGKRHNRQDLYSQAVFHQTLGIGMDFMDPVKRFRLPLVQKKAVKLKSEREMLSEELRILYVALTRAREKLILVGSGRNLEEGMEKWQAKASGQDGPLHERIASGAASLLELIAMAAGHRPDQLKVRWVLPEGLDAQDKPAARSFAGLEILQRSEAFGRIDKQLSFKYPNAAPEDAAVTQSVSEIKRRQELYEQEKRLFSDEGVLSVGHRPRFMEGEKPLGAAQKGTAYHRVFCHLDMDLPAKESQVGSFLDAMADKGMLSKAERASIRERHIVDFLRSSLADRVRAASEGTAIREQPFVMGMEASRLYRDGGSDRIMVQGVIDLFLMEEDGIVLVDYKTDYVPSGTERQLADKYRLQMALYKEALEKSCGRKVKEALIYAVGAGKTVPVALDGTEWSRQ